MHISGGRYPLAGRVALWAVPRRIEIELTSQRDDGTWTWRAAGARRPKGEVSGDLVPDAAAVGSVLRAEVDGGLDGLEILALFAPRARPEPSGRLELIGGGAGPLVTTALVSGSRRNSRTDRGAQREGAGPSRERRRTDDKGDRRRDRDQRDRRDSGAPRRDGDSEGGRPDGPGRKPRRTDRTGRGARDGRDSGTDRTGRGARDGRDSGPDRTGGRETGREGRRSDDRRPEGKPRSKERQALRASVPPEDFRPQGQAGPSAGGGCRPSRGAETLGPRGTAGRRARRAPVH